jgi:hypothetical protein
MEKKKARHNSISPFPVQKYATSASDGIRFAMWHRFYTVALCHVAKFSRWIQFEMNMQKKIITFPALNGLPHDYRRVA